MTSEHVQGHTLKSFLLGMYQCRSLYLMILPAFAITLVFHYFPMGGLVIAFNNYKVSKGIWGSPWVGLNWLRQFITNPYAGRIIRNTLLTGSISFVISFPAPILLALLFNEISNMRFKKLVQTVSYVPHFISTVIIVGMLKNFTSQTGMINNIIAALGGERVLFFIRPEWFRTLYVTSGLWQGLGWGTIIYLAALSGIDPGLYEAAVLDGATRLQKIYYITIPGILPTIATLFILSVPGIIGTDTEKILLMYSSSTYETADVIGTYIHREGIENANYSYSSAVGFALSCVSFLMLFVTNTISRRISDNSLW